MCQCSWTWNCEKKCENINFDEITCDWFQIWKSLWKPFTYNWYLSQLKMGVNMNICWYFCKALICLNALVLHYLEPQHTSIHLKLYSFLHVSPHTMIMISMMDAVSDVYKKSPTSCVLLTSLPFKWYCIIIHKTRSVTRTNTLTPNLWIKWLVPITIDLLHYPS